MAEKLKVVVIAGPNGAGKTTFACEFLPNEADCPVFVNADLIAAGLSPIAPETAALCRRAGELSSGIRTGGRRLGDVRQYRRESGAFGLERKMNDKPIEQAQSADLRGSWPALLRAAQRAREVAARTGTDLIIRRNGVIERIRPEPQTGVAEPAAPYCSRP